MLLLPKRVRWIGPRCSEYQRRGRQSKAYEQACQWERQARKAVGFHLEQKSRDETDQEKRPGDAHSQAEGDHQHDIQDYETSDTQLARAEREPNSDLLGSPDDGITEDGVQANNSQNNSHDGKEPGKQRQ